MQHICIFEMAQNKLAAFRYRILDEIFRNNPGGVTIYELVRRVSDKLEDAHGISSVSARTIKADIQLMRRDPPAGFAAPIMVSYGTGLYRYDDPEYTIFHSLTDKDRANIGHAIQILSQFSELPHFGYLEETLLRLQGTINTEESQQIVFFDHEPQAKGGNWVGPLIEAIQSDRIVGIDYQPFDKGEVVHKKIHPYFIKKYRTRWYLIGYAETEQRLENLGLDRILHLAQGKIGRSLRYMPDPTSYYNDIVGVTHLSNEEPITIEFHASQVIAPFLDSLPIHHSQSNLGLVKDRIKFQICVKPNQELEAAILRYGEHLEVVSPEKISKRIKERAKKLLKVYGN
jgi:predicted DNA-binding transcriptional regulator YafY